MGSIVNISAESMHYNNNVINTNFKHLNNVDQLSHLTVFGFIREFTKTNNNLYIPNDIFNICLLFYYDVNDVYTFIKSFDVEYCDETKWKLSNNNTVANTVSNDLCDYCIYLNNKNKFNGQNGLNKGIHHAAINYNLNNSMNNNAICCFGVTTEYEKRWTSQHQGYWPYIANSSYFNGNEEKPYWTKSSTIIIKLDLNNFVVHFYKESNPFYYNKLTYFNEIELIKTEKLAKNVTYYFMVCGYARKGNTQLSIVSCDKL
eukprot:201480_1